MVSIVAFHAGDQGSKPTTTYFFLLNGHIFLKFYNFIFLNSILEPYKHTLCQYVGNDLIHQDICTKFIIMYKWNFANFFRVTVTLTFNIRSQILIGFEPMLKATDQWRLRQTRLTGSISILFTNFDMFQVTVTLTFDPRSPISMGSEPML